MWVPEEFICQAISLLPEDETQKDIADFDRDCSRSGDFIFPNAYYRLFDRKGFAFPIEYQGREIRCVVSCETLVNRFGAKGADLKTAEVAFLGNKQHIQEIAISLIEKGKVTAENEVVVD